MAERVIPKLTEKDNIRFWEKVDIKSGSECWEWKAFRNRCGYGHFGIRNKRYLASRVAWTIQNGRIPEGLHVIHSCDNPPCCNPAHLSAATRKENMQDMTRKGRNRSVTHPETILRGKMHPFNFKPEMWKRGEGIKLSKLNNEKVLTIRNLYSKGVNAQFLADTYGVTLRNIFHVLSRKTWKHI